MSTMVLCLVDDIGKSLSLVYEAEVISSEVDIFQRSGFPNPTENI